MRPGNGLHDIQMTFVAGALRNLQIVWLDLQRVRMPARCEREGMPETVGSLGGILADEAGGRVAIIANRDGAMARLDPAIVVLLHDVAIGAGCGVVGQVGSALGVHEGVRTNPGNHSNGNTQQKPGSGNIHHGKNFPVGACAS